MRTKGTTRVRRQMESGLQSLIPSAWPSMPPHILQRYHLQINSKEQQPALLCNGDNLLFQEPESQTAAEGESVIFECEAGGFPAPKVHFQPNKN